MLRTLLALAIATAAAAPAIAQDDSDWRDSPKVLACSPKLLKKGGTLTLTLGPHHGAELAIRRTGTSDWYFIVTGGPGKQKFMTPRAFKAARRVTLTDTIEGAADSGKNERVFSKPGRYTIYISDKLESEAGGNICTIRYMR